MSAQTGPLLSVVLPVYNEAAGIGAFLAELKAVLEATGLAFELVLVDDGSQDGTFETLARLRTEHPGLRALGLSRNFGKEAALLAGLSVAAGDVVVTLDADGQHPPDLIPTLLERWRNGAKVVHAIKTSDSYSSALGRIRARVFNGLLSRLGHLQMRGASDFKLLDRRAVDVLVRDMREHQRFYRGLADWIGFPSSSVEFTARLRQTGHTQWNLLALLDMAATAILSFTSAPLRIVTGLGLVTLAFGFVVGLEALWSWIHGESVSGFATLLGSLLLIGSFIMISLGIIGEYLAKIYDEIKARPHYIVDRHLGLDGEPQPPRS